ncbi:MAG TPA: M20/M25/M40 family metallo-hydrolase [Bryobacteraceae bacterium]|nr:M20/M25/M40 family metallo-hydrolase [Bryobacteraceae bacterium]
MSRPKTIRTILCLAAVAIPLFVLAEEKVDLSIINRIKTEAFENSKVMDHMFYLTDVNGPRLTGSPNYKAAADWIVKRMTEYGMAAKEEKWGPFGRGWANKHFEAHLIEPQYQPLIGVPLAWTAGTDGTVTGEPMLVTIRTDADFEKYKGKLKGKIVMQQAAKEIAMQMTVPGRRYTDAELTEEAIAQVGRPTFGPRAPGGQFGQQQPPATPEEARQRREEQRKFQEKLSAFLKDEGALVLLSYGYNGDGGTVFASSGGTYDPKKPVALTAVALTPEHYNRIARLMQHKIPVKLAFNIQNQFYDDNQDSVNVIAEIPGGRKKDEIVMLGAHLDSWHGGTGATDNAAGSAVMMEAIRILKALNLPMDRTVRMGLWGGEEEGLLGSRAYVKEHFGDRETMKLAGEHSKLAGYFNYDNGTGKIRGIYLQGNDMVRPIFESWMAPFKDLGATTITIRNTGGTDHQSFDAVGLPGFQFIQDPMEYNSRTHHSNMDVYDRIQAGDLMQASAIIATFVYNTAMRDEMLPRKPLPKPQPARRGGASTE